MNARLIGMLFGGIAAYKPLVGFADWNIGPSRAAQLAAYADARLRDAVEALQNSIESPTLRSVAKALIVEAGHARRQDILAWDDESLGPKTETGAPLSSIGKGAKAAYLHTIDMMVDRIIENAKQTVKQQNDFLQTAAILVAQYPTVIPTLRDAFIQEALPIVKTNGTQQALAHLKSNLESIKLAGQRKYDG